MTVRLTQEQRRQLIQALNEGATVIQVMERFGIAWSTAKRYKNEGWEAAKKRPTANIRRVTARRVEKPKPERAAAPIKPPPTSLDPLTFSSPSPRQCMGRR
jgi:transposase